MEFLGKELDLVHHPEGYVRMKGVASADQLVLTGTATGDQYADKISSTQVVERHQDITYEATSEIVLKPGFETANGSEFIATIVPSAAPHQEWVYRLSDHLGNTRVLFTDKDGDGNIRQSADKNTHEVLSFYQYSPFGLEQGGSHLNVSTDRNRYTYNNKEKTSLAGYLDYGARFYDPSVGRLTGVDPAAESFSSLTPYNYVSNNPLIFIDPTGAFMSPIYDTEGNFMGTDDQGLQGRSIVMNASDFTQGMSHSDAEAKDLGLGSVSSQGLGKLINHKSELKNRPDYDGYVTIEEGVAWAKANPGALEHPTPDNTLYIDASKLDFGYVFESDFKETGKPTAQNLFSTDNALASVGNSNIRATTYALGRVDMILHNRQTREVSIVNNSATDYDWNKGGGRLRSTFINAERARTGLNDSHGFKAYYYGKGKLADEFRRTWGLDRKL